MCEPPSTLGRVTDPSLLTTMNGLPGNREAVQMWARALAPEALVGNVVRDRRVLQRQRAVCEQATALHGDTRASRQRVPGDRAVDQAELRGLGVSEEGAGEDTAALSSSAGAARGAGVVADGGAA